MAPFPWTLSVARHPARCFGSSAQKSSGSLPTVIQPFVKQTEHRELKEMKKYEMLKNMNQQQQLFYI